MNKSVNFFCRICLFFLIFSSGACAPGPPPPLPFPGFEWIILGAFALAGFFIWKKIAAPEPPESHRLEETLNELNEQLKKLEEKIDRLEQSRNKKNSH